MNEKQAKKVKKLLKSLGLSKEELIEFLNKEDNLEVEDEETDEEVEETPAEEEVVETDEKEVETPPSDAAEEPAAEEDVPPVEEELEPTPAPAAEEIPPAIEEPQEQPIEPVAEEPQEDPRIQELENQNAELKETLQGLSAKLDALIENINKSGLIDYQDNGGQIGIDENYTPARGEETTTSDVLERLNRGRG